MSNDLEKPLEHDAFVDHVVRELMSCYANREKPKISANGFITLVGNMSSVLNNFNVNRSIFGALAKKLLSEDSDEVLSTLKHIVFPLIPKELLVQQTTTDNSSDVASRLRENLACMDELTAPSSDDD